MPQGSRAIRPTNGLYLYLFISDGTKYLTSNLILSTKLLLIPNNTHRMQKTLMYIFFWVFPRRQIVVGRPKRIYTIFKSRRKFEI